MLTFRKRYLFAWIFCLVLWGLSLAPVWKQQTDAIEEIDMPEFIFEKDMSILVSAVKDYYAYFEYYPPGGHGLEVLAIPFSQTPENLTRWARVVPKYLLDPWENPYQFVRKPPNGKRAFGIYSYGRDGLSATNGNDSDDLNTWSGEQDYYIREAEQAILKRLFVQWLIAAHLTFLFMVVVIRYIELRSRKSQPADWEILDG